MEDLAQSWKRLTLFEREGPSCNLTTKHNTTEHSIAAKFLMKRAINVDVIAQTFPRFVGFSFRGLGKQF